MPASSFLVQHLPRALSRGSAHLGGAEGRITATARGPPTTTHVAAGGNGSSAYAIHMLPACGPGTGRPACSQHITTVCAGFQLPASCGWLARLPHQGRHKEPASKKQKCKVTKHLLHRSDALAAKVQKHAWLDCNGQLEGCGSSQHHEARVPVKLHGELAARQGASHKPNCCGQLGPSKQTSAPSWHCWQVIHIVTCLASSRCRYICAPVGR